ncbi:MAG: XdhC family protein [Calditrichaeota bacterium]|nr:XdhC family protein [Calditrichota bacterium]
MKQTVLKEWLACLKRQQPCVLVTVVETRGSSPQKAGARLLVRPDGSFVGTLGGGCVEGDLWYRAKRLLAEGGTACTVQHTLNAELAAQDGMVCGGTMRFLLEPFPSPHVSTRMLSELENALEGDSPVAMVTVVDGGKTNLPVGLKVIIRMDGTVLGEGTFPVPDKSVIARARQLAPYGENQLIDTQDGARIFLEGITAPVTLILLGGGHVNKAIASLARHLDFRIIVIDDRAEFANPERFPEADEIYVAPYDQALRQFNVPRNAFIIAATRGHRYDDRAVQAAVATPARYIGVLGSKRKILMILRHLRDDGTPASRLENVYAPVGLDIGALTPEEIAISVLAEIIMIRRGGQGRPMRLQIAEFQKTHLNSSSR